MAVTTFYHGHPTTLDEDTQTWHYDDTGENIKDVPVPPCPKCKLPSREDGHDPCIANLPGVKFACCGHGKKGWGYISFDNGRSFKVDGMNEFVVAEDGTTTYPLGRDPGADIDYRALLKKYIEGVGGYEGIDYIDVIDGVTDEERAELQAISDE